MKYAFAALLTALAALPAQAASSDPRNPFDRASIRPIRLPIRHIAARPNDRVMANVWFFPDLRFTEVRQTFSPGIEYIFIYVPR